MMLGAEMPVRLESSAAEALRREQVRAVGTAFLRFRPAVVAVGIVLNAACLAASGAPALQRALVTSCMGSLWLAFVAEAWALRRKTVTELWLQLTLALTFVALTFACAITGGARSPLLPLLFAPVGVGFAAFGRARGLSLFTGLAASVVAGLALLPEHPDTPPVAPPWDAAMTVVSAGAALVLLRIGVAGLADAHAASSAKLERFRAGALLEARERALQSEALSAKVAHELKNPLTAIKGLVQLLERSAAEEREQKRFRVALDEIERMQHILEEYLSFARTPGERALRPVSLDTLLRDVALLVEPSAAEQEITIELATEPVTLSADLTRLKDAILNLVSNALAAMPRGGELRLAVERDASVARVVVSDSGAGMSEGQLVQAGTPFVSHRADGTGLGLALARGVARQHGGDLELVSAQGRGTRATLSLSIEHEERS